MPILYTVSELTPSLLTELFRRRGILNPGEVRGIDVTRSIQQTTSKCHYLQVRYSAGVDLSTVPTRLFLKISDPDFAWQDDKEQVFYGHLLPTMQSAFARLPFVTCYDATFDAVTKQSHLLLEDLSMSHFAVEGHVPPSPELAEQVIDWLARLHGFWWEHPLLGVDVGELLTDARIDDFLAIYPERLRNLMAQAGAQFSVEEYELLETAISAWPQQRRERIVAGSGITLIHRDLNPGNVFYPRDVETDIDAKTDIVKLIDWQSWRVDTGTDDLAYWMGVFWVREFRRRYESMLLARYYEKLVESGVESYSWAQCEYDYMASIVRVLTILMMINTPRIPAIKRCLETFQDWKCWEIL